MLVEIRQRAAQVVGVEPDEWHTQKILEEADRSIEAVVAN
jgi:hypothetical protein